MPQLPTDRCETWMTGIGLVSSLGDGLEANCDALRNGRIDIDLDAQWMIHPLAPLILDSQIPKKGDQCQMEAWQPQQGSQAGRTDPSITGSCGNTPPDRSLPPFGEMMCFHEIYSCF